MIDHNFMKRMAPLLVLEVLKVHTDEEHGLKVTQIAELLEQDYNVVLERKAVSRILNDLLELSEIPENYDWKNPMRFSIKYETTKRKTGDIRDGWRLCKEFEDAELRLMIDALLSIRSYPSQRLLNKLLRLGTRSLRDNSRYVQTMSGTRAGGPRLPVNVFAIDSAINEGRKVAFHYGGYGVDKQFHLQKDSEGNAVQYKVTPYQMAFRNGIYYLICNPDGTEDLTHFRVDGIRDAHGLEEKAKEYSDISGSTGWKLSLRSYLDQHIHMCDGKTVMATFQIPKTMVSDVLDLFGDCIDLSQNSDTTVTVRAEVNREAMIRYAKTYAPEVRVLAPVTLVEEVKQTLRQALKTYE